MKKVLSIALAVLVSIMVIMIHTAYSQETEVTQVTQESATEETAPSEAYTFPTIKPEASLFLGARLAGSSGSPRADQYEYLHDYVPFGGELRLFEYPHRLHLDVDIQDQKDYFGDLSYSYKDLILFRGIDRTVWHNLVNIPLIDLNPATPSPGVDVRDSGVEYGTKTSINNASLRFKMPDFPLHIYLDGSYIDKSGSMQQRFLGGSGYFNNIVRVSEQRDVDWVTKGLLMGINSHLGPIEADFSHGERRFDSSGTQVFQDFYTDAGVRPAGVFEHNLIPDFKSSSNTLKLHTSYTGSIVASATLSNIDTKNDSSGTKADYVIGTADFTWMPMPKLTFYVKYRYKDTDFDNPSSVTISDLSNPFQTFTYPVKAAISSTTNTVSGTVRYLPIKGVTLRAEYAFQNVDRENASLWGLPDSTQSNTVTISADTRILKGLNFKAQYTYLQINNPAYNTDPNHSNAAKFSLSWVPIPQVNTYVSYTFAREKRDNVSFVEADGTITTTPNNRDVKKDMVMGSATFLILKDLSLTGSYAYMHNNTQQDIGYSDLAGVPQIDSSVPNKETAQTFAVDVNYMPKDNITLHAGVSYTLSSGQFYPSSADLLQPVSVGSFSALKERETAYTLSGEYRFKNGFGLELRYKYCHLNDVQNNPYDDVQNGNANIFMVLLSKRW
jgi:predicted porin